MFVGEGLYSCEGGVDVAFEAADGAVTALGFELEGSDTSFGEMGEAGAADLMERLSPGGLGEDLCRLPIGQPSSTGGGTEVAGCGENVGLVAGGG